MKDRNEKKLKQDLMALPKAELVKIIMAQNNGTKQFQRGVAAKALTTYRRARDNCRAIGGRTHNDAAREYQNICYFLRKEYRTLGISRVSEDWKPK